MSTILYIDATTEAVEKFLGAKPGTIVACEKAHQDFFEEDRAKDGHGDYAAFEKHVEEIDPLGAHSLYYDGLGRVMSPVPKGDEYVGEATGSAAVAMMLEQRNRHPVEGKILGIDTPEEYAKFRQDFMQTCYRVAMAISDGRFKGVTWS